MPKAPPPDNELFANPPSGVRPVVAEVSDTEPNVRLELSQTQTVPSPRVPPAEAVPITRCPSGNTARLPIGAFPSAHPAEGQKLWSTLKLEGPMVGSKLNRTPAAWAPPDHVTP